MEVSHITLAGAGVDERLTSTFTQVDGVVIINSAGDGAHLGEYVSVGVSTTNPSVAPTAFIPVAPGDRLELDVDDYSEVWVAATGYQLPLTVILYRVQNI